MKRVMLLVCVFSLVLAAVGVAQAAPKNVILMISDGWGYNQIAAADHYYGTTASYEGAGFVSYAMKTNSANNPAGYNPAQASILTTAAETTTLLSPTEGIASNMDVIIGAGNPEYDDNGNPATKSAQFVGGDATWAALKAGELPADPTPGH